MITVINWISWGEAHEREESIGGMGGHFERGMRGQVDYFDYIKPKYKPYYEALRKEIIDNKIKVSGERHQRDMVPLFSDDTVGTFSYRSWGDLMAATWSEHEDEDYSYFDFYMDCTMKEKRYEA